MVWDGQGIAPETAISVFDPQNPFVGHVEAVRAIIRLIVIRLAPDGADDPPRSARQLEIRREAR